MDRSDIGKRNYIAIGLLCFLLLACVVRASHAMEGQAFRPEGTRVEPGLRRGKAILPGVTILTGHDLKPYQTSFPIPELADPYVTVLKDSAIVSGTAQYYLRFRSVEDIARGGPYQIIWNDYYYADGTPMEGGRFAAHSWDMKPVLWSRSKSGRPRLWDQAKDKKPPLVVWYGGHMRPRDGKKISGWPEDNYSRDVFAFVEKTPGKWFSRPHSIFSRRGDWPRPIGNYLGHRYGHQIVMVPKMINGRRVEVAAVFFEEVTEVRENGSPLVTKIFMDEMVSPFQARGNPVELVSPVNPATGKPFPGALREDGSALVEGPLYFRFKFKGEDWEGIGFSAGSFYGSYPSCFASRKVSDGFKGKPYLIDLKLDGSDLHNAGAELGRVLNLAGGPGRPAVITGRDGVAVAGPRGSLQVLVHGYRQDILPDNDYSRFPVKYRLDQMFRVMIHSFLKVEKTPRGSLHFRIWVRSLPHPSG